MVGNKDIIIEVKDLHKSYNDNHILDGVSFVANKGDLISIIGRSGCGKTTLLRCLNCLEFFDKGTIHIAGLVLSRNQNENSTKNNLISKFKKTSKDSKIPFKDFDKKALDEDFHLKAMTLRTKVGMLFQNLNLFPHLNVLENVTLAPVIVKKENKTDSRKTAIQLLEKVGLGKFTDRYPNQLSGGQAQRVAIARALAMSPQVMLYDEPTSALDPELVGEVIEVMNNLHSEGMTQIVVTHAMYFAKTASDYVMYMEEGKIIEMKSPDIMFNNPADERTQKYISILKD